MGDTLRKKRNTPSKRPNLLSKDSSYAERGLPHIQSLFPTVKEGKGRRAAPSSQVTLSQQVPSPR